MKEFNNRDVANQFAEYITGKELRKYVADKVKKYVGDNPTVFDGACGSGQLEQFVNPKKLVGVEIQEKACEVCRENYENSEVHCMSFFNYESDVLCDCAIMNPPFSLKLKERSDEEIANIQEEFPWKKSGVVDDIFVLKSLKYTKRYGFYILFPGVGYRKTEKQFRKLIGYNLKEFNLIQNAFEDTQIPVIFIVIDKEKNDCKVLREIYDCKTCKQLMNDEYEIEELGENWQQPVIEKKREEIDPVEVETSLRKLSIKNLDNSLNVSKFVCDLDSDLPPFKDYVSDLKKVIEKYERML